MSDSRILRFTSYVLRPPTLLAVMVFLLAAALYLRTTCPTLGGGWDSEEFQHAAYTLGIAHSTGYPLYLSLGKIFTTVVPIGNIAYRMNLLSALLTAGAVAFVYLIAMQLTRRYLASLATAALFATNVAVWRQAGVASVAPLNLLLLGAMVYALLGWHARRAQGEDDLVPTLPAFLFGLSLAHHRSTLFLAPAIALFVLLVDSNILHRPRAWARSFLWLIFPLALYLYIPIVGSGSPWYSNTLQGFINHISGSEAGSYTRSTWGELMQVTAGITQYLHDSFGVVGLVLIVIGAVSAMQTRRVSKNPSGLPNDARVLLFFGLGEITFAAFAILVVGEPDRYLVLPFFFLVFWFAIGVGAVEYMSISQSVHQSINRLMARLPDYRLPACLIARVYLAAQAVLAATLALLVILPFNDRFRAADWSAFDRVYKQWDEIFSLPIPRHATLVGNWSQLNAMRYMQRVENRRTDLQLVGTLYDPAPQTDAARDAFAAGRAIFLAPGIALPVGSYRYALLGPLLEVRAVPQLQPPADPKGFWKPFGSAWLTLVGFGITTALEPYAPTTSIAPSRTARVTLTWRAEGSVEDFLVRLRLYDPEARAISQKDEPPVRGLYPASQWQRGEYISDVHNFLIPPGTPPGTYQLKLQTLDAETKAPTSDEIALTPFSVVRATNLTREQVFVQHPLDLALDSRIALWGYGGLDGTRRAGETITINLLWHARENVGEDLTLHLALVDASGRTVKAWQRAFIAFYPTREWQRGEILKAYYDLQLPDDLSPGELTLAVGEQQAAGSKQQTEAAEMVTIGKIRIAPP